MKGLKAQADFYSEDEDTNFMLSHLKEDFNVVKKVVNKYLKHKNIKNLEGPTPPERIKIASILGFENVSELLAVYNGTMNYGIFKPNINYNYMQHAAMDQTIVVEDGLQVNEDLTLEAVGKKYGFHEIKIKATTRDKHLKILNVINDACQKISQFANLSEKSLYKIGSGINLSMGCYIAEDGVDGVCFSGESRVKKLD